MKHLPWRLLRRIGWGFFTLIIVLMAIYWDLVIYGIRQGWGQMNIIWHAQPVEEVLQDPHFPDSLKTKLLLIEEVRRFAVDSLGLSETDNYKSLYDQQGKEVMWVVTAAEPYQLKAKEWDFPIVGSVPYKGFFVEQLALNLAEELQSEGWDVNVRNPGGWSTLGWFNDPILSKMLQRSTGDLASLIIHEMVHATIFVKDSVDFNENLASFIGDRGAELFLASKFGKDSDEFKQFIQEDYDYMIYVDHILRSTDYLKQVYNQMANEPIGAKKKDKEKALRHIVESMDTLSFHSGKIALKKFENTLPNNAYFMSFIHYQSGQKELRQEWERKFNRNIKQYISYLSEKHPFL